MRLCHMFQFTPAYFFSDEPNLAKKKCSCERAIIHVLKENTTQFSIVTSHSHETKQCNSKVAHLIRKWCTCKYILVHIQLLVP